MRIGDDDVRDAMRYAHVAARQPHQITPLRDAYLGGLYAERAKNRRLILSMAKRIAAQSEKLTRKAKKGA